MVRQHGHAWLPQSGFHIGIDAAGRPGGRGPAAVAGGLRADHAGARNSEAGASGCARRGGGGGALRRRVRRQSGRGGDCCRRMPGRCGTSRRDLPEPARRNAQRVDDGAFRRRRFAPVSAHFRFRPAYNVRIPRAQEILGTERKVHTAEHLASAIFYLGADGARCRGRGWGGRRPEPGAGRLAVIHACGDGGGKDLAGGEFSAGSGTSEEVRAGAGFHWRGGGRSVGFSRLPDRARGAAGGNHEHCWPSAALFVGNDSGPAHMAAAFGLPVVVIFGPSDPAIWGPWRTAREVVTAPGGIAA